mgnify:CR=1 FL=1
MLGKTIIFATIKQSAMSEEEKSPQKITPNPDGYDITIYPEYWVGVLSVAIPIVLVFVFKGMLKPLFLSLNEWLALGIFCVFLSILVFLSLFLIWKLTNAKVNIRLTDVGLEQRKVSGASWIPENRIVKWEDMRYFYLFGIRGGCGRHAAFDGNDFFIGTKQRPYSFVAKAFFRREREQNMVMKSFRSDFLRLASQHGIERKKLWEEKKESFDKKHLEW